ncbi:phage tail tube protein [Metabacillus herbersteinensis]|uniref:Phage tail tube protein n=1 Tax=Metabacillus herbersteinensis TaxID=283816 RepID=A0ABV6GBS9_9BACI
MPGFELMNAHDFKINTVPGTTPGTLAAIAAGITNVEPSPNEELSQDKYLDGDGYGETDVIGAQIVLAFTGHRKYGDVAQDFIFSKMLELGASRRTNFEWTEPGGGKFAGPCTIANISGPSGAAGAKGEISFEIHFNGKPTYTPPVVTP